jgi:hypothetical protein
MLADQEEGPFSTLLPLVSDRVVFAVNKPAGFVEMSYEQIIKPILPEIV